ncbi:MAG: hypothetical protein ACT4N5_01440 [Nitrosopumilaceae archaeon]
MRRIYKPVNKKLKIVNSKIIKIQRKQKPKWIRYIPKRICGYLDWYFCDPEADKYPTRDISKRNKTEPHYEDLTFNLYNKCNQPLLRGSLYRGDSHVFFFTKYKGKEGKFRNKYFITGYYEIGFQDKLTGHIAVRAKKGVFVKIDDAIPLETIIDKIKDNSRWLKKKLNQEKTNEILEKLNEKTNYISRYCEVLTY